MKNILVFIDWYWPGYKAGGTVRAFMNIVSYLKDEFTFHIITRDTDYTESEPYAGIEPDEWNKLEDNVFVYYASAKNVTFRNWKRLIRETPHDTVYIHGIFSFWFSVLPIYIAKRTGTGKILVAAHGMLGDHAFKIKSTKKGLFIRLARFVGLYRGVEFHAANAGEAEDIVKRAGKKAEVRIAHELPRNERLAMNLQKTKQPGHVSLVWMARIAPEKNLKTAFEILSGITQGDIHFDIYGPVYDQDYWNDCMALLADMPQNVVVSYKGSIPGDKVSQALQQYHCLFLPTSGENFGHAILESMMAGCPVIISDKTPWRGLEEKGCGFDLSLEKPQLFRDKIEQLVWTGQEDFEQMQQSTLTYISEYLQNPEALSENINLFKK